jgi:hypothetical protein
MTENPMKPVTTGEAIALIAPAMGMDPDDVGGWAIVLLSKHDVTLLAASDNDPEKARYLLNLGLTAVPGGELPHA